MLMINRRKIVALIMVLTLSGYVAGTFNFQLPMVWAKTKIAPTKGEPGHPFTIINTPEHRLIDGSKAVFKLGDAEVVIDLRTHKPYSTAQGVLPLDITGGDYTVFCRQPDGTVIEIGMFKVLAPVAEPTQPSISPTIGEPTTTFTITDPQGRMIVANLIILTPEGESPEQGLPVTDAWFSPDGKTATGTIPPTAQTGQNFISVHANAPTEPPLFNALAFTVSAGGEPSVEPTSGWVGDWVTIIDPQGRIGSSDLAVFYVEGTDPAAGSPGNDVSISSDGTTLTCKVPGDLSRGSHYISVRPTQTADSRFGDLAFTVS